MVLKIYSKWPRRASASGMERGKNHGREQTSTITETKLQVVVDIEAVGTIQFYECIHKNHLHSRD